MKIVICGSRDFTDGEAMFRWLDMFHAGKEFKCGYKTMTGSPIDLVIEGGQRKWCKETRSYIGGADFWANEWAKSRGVEVVTVKADWGDTSGPRRKQFRQDGSTFNAGAGPIRNKKNGN